MKSPMSYPPLTESKRQTWVQTDRSAHEAWGKLIATSPRAAQLMHHIVAHMDQSAAVVASYATLAGICGFSVATVRRAIDDLRKNNWIQVVQIGGKGGANAFIVNSRVAWAAPRDSLPLAAFTARVLTVATEQDAETLSGPPLKRIPHLMNSLERQLPTGDGEDPPSQPSIPGLEPDLPSIKTDFESSGQTPTLNIDPETGEIK
jgi:DNA-binding transcriptional regulator YhcF (GntR family)